MAHQHARTGAIENQFGRGDAGVERGLRDLRDIDCVAVMFKDVRYSLPSRAVSECTVDQDGTATAVCAGDTKATNVAISSVPTLIE